MDNSAKFKEYRKEYKSFIYRAYHKTIENNKLKVTFDFETPGLAEFHPTWEFPVGRNDLQDKNISEVLDVLLFNLGMTEAISYYKCVCPEKVIVEAGHLSEKKSLWWRKLFYNGLGEFIYRNGINIREEELLTIESKDGKEELINDDTDYKGFMIPVGGGKDSVVSLEILKDEDVSTYHINHNSSAIEVIEVFNDEKTDLCALRTLDKNMLELNKQGYLNGHTPFSAIVAFSSVITAFLNKKKFIALSNETSANETTVKDSFVNHQYSKSYEFEKDFDEYLHSLISSDIHYFSFLRPLTELQIAALFSTFRSYHSVFRSCNVGSKKGIWCCDCPKCLFVYIILSPFLSEKEVINIFGEKLLDKESLEKDFRELTGLDENKPFECVGTRGEVIASLKAYIAKGGRSILTEKYRNAIEAGSSDIKEYMKAWEKENFLPDGYEEKLKGALEKCVAVLNI
ncbi:hypothetical protein QYZ88_006725 [Lachnospiraceae bacterium C1.1]|nr:hypothetical protein [Lachnospiraceae bacterium C1.1]